MEMAAETKNLTRMDVFCGSTFWDLNVTWYTSDPDFPPCFQHTVLSWIPCVFLWIFSPVAFNNIVSSKDSHIPHTFLNVSKSILLLVLLILAALELFLGFQLDPSLPVNLFTPMVKILTYVLALFLVRLDKSKGVVSSGVLFIFWFLAVACGLVEYRTQIRGHATEDTNEDVWRFVIYMVYYPVVVAQLSLALFPDSRPRSRQHQDIYTCPEIDSSFLSKLTYHWFQHVIWTGFRRPLIKEDLWNLNERDTAAKIIPEFEKYWDAAKKKRARRLPRNSFASYSLLEETQPAKPVSIFTVLLKMYSGRMVLGASLKLIYDLLIFCSPRVLDCLIGFIASNEEVWKGYLYAVLLFGIAVVQTLCLNEYFYVMFTFGMNLQTTIVAAVYKKALKLSNAAKKESTTGEAVNLMSVDARRVQSIAAYINLIWSSPLQICLSLYFLWDKLGPSVFAGVSVMILLLPLNAWMAHKTEILQKQQMEKKDERIKLMNEILNGIKVLKLYAWEPSFENEVMKIRNEEIQNLKSTAYYNTGSSFGWQATPYLVSLVSFATYVLVSKDNTLDAQTAFVSLMLFHVLQFPMSVFPMLISSTVQTYVSIKRIDKFMNSGEIDENNVKRNESEYAVSIENGSFSWSVSDDVILRDICLQVSPGQLVAVVGTVGAGKSSLISAILGEMEVMGGSVNCKGTISYVPQQAWIQNLTLKDNILMGRQYHEKNYNDIIKACALTADMDILPAGDETEIGEKGINLSGGQKQRVSLARALYSDHDICLLDDPLSAVDSHVGKHIFDQVISGEGLLRHKTRILVTHGISFLRRVDHIVVMKDGGILECGSFQELLDQKGAFSDFLMEYFVEKADGDVIEEELEGVKESLESCMGKDAFQRQLSTKTEEYKMSCEGEESPKRRVRFWSKSESVKSAEEEEKKKKPEGQRLIETETTETGRIQLSVFKAYFGTIGWTVTALVVFFNLLGGGCEVASSIWLSHWSEAASSYSNTTMPIKDRDVFLGIYGALGFGEVSMILLYTGMTYISLLNVSKKLHARMLRNVMRCPQQFFDQNPIGRIVSRFSNDVYAIDVPLPFIIDDLRITLTEVLVTMVIISYTTPMFLAAAVPLLIVYFIVQRVYVNTSRQLQRMESVSRTPIYSHFGETLAGVSSIRAYRMQQQFIAESQKRVDQNQVYFYYANVAAARWLSVRLETFGNVVILLAGVFAVMEQHTVFAGLVGLSLSYAVSVTQSLNWVVRMASDVETNIVSVERMEEFAKEKTEAPWEIEDRKPPPGWPNRGDVVFNKYSTRYREGLDLVLKEVTFSIKAREKVGIVGRTGAGKSSLTLALFRLIEPVRGEIRIDDIDIYSIGLHDLRRNLTIIPQDPVLFSGSLRFNLDPFEAYTDEELWKALEHAHLKNFVKGLAKALHHEVTEGGENLSVGQRQLVCLARALLRNSRILILDEATAAVDLETDSLIQETIRTQFKDSTVITIAHRLNTIMDYERVMVLDQGKIKEFDSPGSLLKNNSSMFYAMAREANLV